MTPGNPDPVTLGAGPLATPIAEAVRAVAGTYAEQPGVDIEDRLRSELAHRGAALADPSVTTLARAIRAGRSEELLAGDPTGLDAT